MDTKEIGILGQEITEHWYYRSKAKAMMQMLYPERICKILDIGAGSGFFSRYLLQNTPAQESWCVDISYVNDFEEMEQGKPIHFRRSVDTVDANLVLLMDVLEHVDDDVGLLKAYADKVPHGSQFLVSVPAFQSLWSDHDVFLEHKRRYTLAQIENTIECAGLKIKLGAYYFGAVFPIVATLRLTGRLLGGRSQTPRSQLKRHSRAVNEALALVSSAEIPVMKHNRIAGLTAFCLAETT